LEFRKKQWCEKNTPYQYQVESFCSDNFTLFLGVLTTSQKLSTMETPENG